MKRGAAFVVYYIGAAWILYSLIQFAASASSWMFLAAPLILAAYWWIIAGIGIRLGVRPIEFFGWFGRFAGFVDPPKDSGSESSQTTQMTDGST